MKKKCSKCQLEHPAGMFHNNRRTADGLHPHCKQCRHAYNEANRAKIRAYNKRYREANKEAVSASKRKWSIRNPNKTRAHVAASIAISRGDISRTPCLICGEQKTQAHHDDYTKPLKVTFFCELHHKAWHRLFVAVGDLVD